MIRQKNRTECIVGWIKMRQMVWGEILHSTWYCVPPCACQSRPPPFFRPYYFFRNLSQTEKFWTLIFYMPSNRLAFSCTNFPRVFGKFFGSWIPSRHVWHSPGLTQSPAKKMPRLSKAFGGKYLRTWCPNFFVETQLVWDMEVFHSSRTVMTVASAHETANEIAGIMERVLQKCSLE